MINYIDWLKQKEYELNISPEEISQKLGIKLETYNSYKYNKRIPRKCTIKHFCEVFNLNKEKEYSNWKYVDGFTPEELEIINGHLLGDGTLYKRSKNVNTLFRLERSLKDLEYLKWSHCKLLNYG